MARFNTALTSSSISGTATISTPYSGAFTEFTGTAPYTVTLPSPTLFPGVNQTFYNATSGQVTLSVSGATFSGTGGTGSATFVLNAGNVVSIFSDGTNYIVISEDGSPLVATTGSFSGNVTINGGSATLSATPQTVTLNPTGASTIDNINIGVTTRGSGAFNTLTANQAVTFTANTASSGTGTGTLVVTGGVGVSGNINSGATVTGVNLAGTISTASQTNITAVGTLTALTVSGATNLATSSGNVGIGTTNTYNLKTVIAGAGAASSTGSGSYLVASLADTTAMAQDVGGGLGFQGNDGVNGLVTFASINGSKENATSGNYASYLSFKTRVNSGNLTERVRIDSSGNVGIGNTSPNGKLHVGLVGMANTATATIANMTDFGVSSRMGFDGLANNNDGIYFGMGINGGINAGMGFFREASGWNSALTFYTNNVTDGVNVSKMQEKMRITSAGNVGIGTTNPTTRLQVNNASDSRIIIYETGTTPYTATLELASQGIGTYGALLQYTSGAETLTLKAYGRTATGTTQGSILFNTKVANTTDTTAMTIHGFSGNVGIGTISPQNTLQVNGSLSSYNQSSSAGAIATSYSEIVTTPINLGASVGVDVGTISVTTDTCWKAVVRGTFSNNYDGGGLTPPAFYIELNSVQNTIPCGGTSITVARNASTNKLRFTNTSGTYTVAFTGTVEIIVNTQSGQSSRSITTIGAVGVGTNAPAAQLHVLNTGGSTNSPNTALILDYESNSTAMTGAGTAIEFRGKSSGGNIANYSQARIRSTSQDNNNAHGIAFDYKPNAATALTEAMNIDAGGQLNLNGALNQTGVRTRSGTFSLPGNSGTVITITLSNYSYMHFKFYALRTNGGNSIAYWDGILNNNNNSSYTNAIAQSSGLGAVTFTVASGSSGVWTFTFNFNGSGGYGYYICEDMNMGSISVAYP
jgi:hypothetical protein